MYISTFYYCLSKLPLFTLKCPPDILANRLRPPIRGILRLPVAVPAGRFICIALGFCDIWLAPYIRFTPRQIFLRKINSSKPPAPPIRGISRLPVAVPAGRFICIALGFCDICPAGHIYGSRLGKSFFERLIPLNPLRPLSGGFRDCSSRSLRDVLFALLSASAIFGWRHIYGCASAKQINLLCSRLLRIFEVGSGYGPDRTVFARNRSNSGPVKPYDD